MKVLRICEEIIDAKCAVNLQCKIVWLFAIVFGYKIIWRKDSLNGLLFSHAIQNISDNLETFLPK